MATVTYSETETYVVAHCGVCGIAFGVTKDFNDRCIEDSGKSFFCPNGHSLSYTTSKIDRLKDELSRQTEARARDLAAHARTRECLENAKHQIRAQKAAKTRLKNRIKNGVCPCCNRTFKDLARHMGSQHPGYAGSGGDHAGS